MIISIRSTELPGEIAEPCVDLLWTILWTVEDTFHKLLWTILWTVEDTVTKVRLRSKN